MRGCRLFNRTLIAEAGCTLNELQRVVEKELFFVRFFFKEFCVFGRAISNKCWWFVSSKYGVAKDCCLGLEVVLPNGAIGTG